jgi:hypothetical protein
MKPSIQYVNPHTRYEINLQRTPRWFNLVAVILCMITLTATIWIYFKEVPSPLPRLSKPQLPNVSAAIEQKVSDVEKKVVGK